MRHGTRRFSFPLSSLALVCVVALASPRAGAADEPATEIVQPSRFVQTLELSGVLEPRESEAVAFEPEVYGGALEVVRALGDGQVEKGTVLVQFDDEEAREALDAAERELHIATLKHRALEHELVTKRKQHELRLIQLETETARAEEALQRFLEIEKPERIAQSAYNLEGTENRLQDQTEELEQLEKMYKEDDLTEETEEIVLRRTRRNLVRSRKSLEWARRRHETLLEVTIPRDEENLRMSLRQKQVELADYRQTAPLRLGVAEIELAKSSKGIAEKKERLDELRHDLDQLRLRAPVAGLAVRGAFGGGKWQDLDGLREALQPEGKVKARQTLYTIVHPGNVELVASVEEAERRKIAVGREAEVEAAVLADRRLVAEVAEVAVVGVGGKLRVVVALKETDPVLLPGQSAKATVAWRTVPDALTVPASALVDEGGKRYVHVFADGRVEPREVECGATEGDRVEITSGLAAGDAVVVSPKAKK